MSTLKYYSFGKDDGAKSEPILKANIFKKFAEEHGSIYKHFQMQ